jgi:hypothetical protein
MFMCSAPFEKGCEQSWSKEHKPRVHSLLGYVSCNNAWADAGCNLGRDENILITRACSLLATKNALSHPLPAICNRFYSS